MKDPYFRRLSATDKKAFWKIFASLDIDDRFRDLFERMTERDPNNRASIQDVKEHSWI
jgi:serine/threonine protein kinase